MILDLLTENEGPISLVTYFSRYTKKSKLHLGLTDKLACS